MCSRTEPSAVLSADLRGGGGLLSKGHPLGAMGLAQCTERVQQLRGRAGERQVDGATLALQHNLGLGSACVVTLHGRGGAAVSGSARRRS